MLKISRVDAYQGMDEMDFKVMDYELDLLFNSDQRNGRDMTIQYYLEDAKSITMVVYWAEKEVARYRFSNKAQLTEQGKKGFATIKGGLQMIIGLLFMNIVCLFIGLGIGLDKSNQL